MQVLARAIYTVWVPHINISSFRKVMAQLEGFFDIQFKSINCSWKEFICKIIHKIYKRRNTNHTNPSRKTNCSSGKKSK